MFNWLRKLLFDPRSVYVGHIDKRGLIDEWPLSIDPSLTYSVLLTGDWKPVVTIRETEKSASGNVIRELCLYLRDAERLAKAILLIRREADRLAEIAKRVPSDSETSDGE